MLAYMAGHWPFDRVAASLAQKGAQVLCVPAWPLFLTHMTPYATIWNLMSDNYADGQIQMSHSHEQTIQLLITTDCLRCLRRQYSPRFCVHTSRA